MRAYYELETNIPLNHQITIQLPDNIPVRQATIAVIYELNQNITNNLPQLKTLVDFLGTGKKYQRFSSTSEIDNFVSENRETWEN
ncbi:MAG: hypothetical protein RIT27_113 [Pseudomonadota bacterium]|jgi:hypothetical protein